MRASEIRNLLIQKYGVQYEEVAKILDKNELKEMLATLSAAHVNKEAWQNMASNLLRLMYGAFVVVMLLFAARPMIGALKSIRSKDNKTLYKLRLMWSQAKKRRLSGAIYLFLSLLLDFVSFGMSISVLLSWILSESSPYRKYLFPMLSFPLNTNTLSSVLSGGGNTQSFNHGTGNAGFGLDIGPMMTISGVNWLISRLENMSASVIMRGKRRKAAARSETCHSDLSESTDDMLSKPSARQNDETTNSDHPLRWRRNPNSQISISQQPGNHNNYPTTSNYAEESNSIVDGSDDLYRDPTFDGWDD
jgi:hypothetical protein